MTRASWCALALVLGACSAFVDEDEVCIEIEVEYAGSARGELYVHGTEFNFNREHVGDHFRYFADSEVGLEALEPSSLKGSMTCSGGGGFKLPERWTYSAWIDTDGSSAALCESEPLEKRSLDCAPQVGDPQVTMDYELEPGKLHVLVLEIVDP